MARPRKAAPITLAGGTNPVAPETPSVEKSASPKRPAPAVPVGERPQVDAISAIVVGGQNPDAVLVRVRQPEGAVAYVGAARSGRPIDNLRYKLPAHQQISDMQYRAAEVFLALFSGVQKVGSNTQNILNNAVYEVPPEAWEREAYESDRAFGRIMRTGETAHTPKQDDVDRIGAVWRYTRVTQRLTREYRAILDDLIIRELGVGAIARRWGVSPDAMGLSVRFALANLVRILEEVDAEFRSWTAAAREV